MRAFVLCLAASVLAACGNPTMIDGKQYSAACTVANDCTSAYFGDQCAPCACPNAAIAVSQRELYLADATTARQSCGPTPAIACVPCADVTVSCNAGACAIQ